jgi:hypothetical protein
MVDERFAILPPSLPVPGRLHTIAYEDYDQTSMIDPEQLRPMRPRGDDVFAV